MSPVETARAARSKKSEEKKLYVKSLLQNDHTIPDRTLLELVGSKFGSGLATTELDEVRHSLGWTWDKKGRGRKLVPVSPGKVDAVQERTKAVGAQAVTPGGLPVAASQPVVTDRGTERALRSFVMEDEKLEVELIEQLQALMRRQNYSAIMIPREGTAHIRVMIEAEKKPGEHVESVASH